MKIVDLVIELHHTWESNATSVTFGFTSLDIWCSLGFDDFWTDLDEKEQELTITWL